MLSSSVLRHSSAKFVSAKAPSAKVAVPWNFMGFQLKDDLNSVDKQICTLS